tara:strand:+ start:1128 stop:1925 length:798 start_codon:yes stop_codon:yes gene_type:complete
MLRTLAAATAVFAAGYAAALLQLARRRRREAIEMARRSVAAAAPGDDVGTVSVVARGDRSFGVSAHDTALVVIDMQTDFLSAEGRIGRHYQGADVRESLEATTAKVAQLLQAARRAGLTIAHSRSHRYAASVRLDLVGTGDEGYELAPPVRALPGEIVVDKWTFGAFASTSLEAELRQRGVKRILLAGVLTNVCVFQTAVQAVDRFFRVCLVDDACGAFRSDWHEKAVALMNEPQIGAGHASKPTGLYFAEVASVSDVEAALAAL